MKEVTRIINLQITGIFKTEEYKGDANEAAKKLAAILKVTIDADDILVLEAKDFVRDIVSKKPLTEN